METGVGAGNIWVFLQALAALFFDGCVMILGLNAIS
jgi:hypothetical protein